MYARKSKYILLEGLAQVTNSRLNGFGGTTLGLFNFSYNIETKYVGGEHAVYVTFQASGELERIEARIKPADPFPPTMVGPPF